MRWIMNTPRHLRCLLLGGLLVFLVGCQIQKPAVNGSSFMSLWNAYNHCQSSSDPDAMRADVRRLSEAADSSVPGKDDPIGPLLRPIQRWIAPSPSRFSADPKAMAAACTVYTGQVALAGDRPGLAAEMFRTVIQNYPQPQYAYYVGRAWAELLQLYEVDPGSQTGT